MQAGVNLCGLRKKRVSKGAITSFLCRRMVEVYGIGVLKIFLIVLMVSIFGKFTSLKNK